MGLTYSQTKEIVDLTPYPRPDPLTAQEKEDACGELLKYLCRERGLIAAFSTTYERKRSLVRDYMNERPAHPIPSEILSLQDRLLWTESLERRFNGELPYGKYGIGLWQGDITALETDGIVNAANRQLLGCFRAGHHCIDNAIHSFAGMQLRSDCAKIVAVQGEERSGEAKITRAYNLPCRYVLHTVGPVILQEVTETDRATLRASYTSCLDLAEEAGLHSLAFCCISTGVFSFPHEEAAEIATGAVLNWKLKHNSPMKVLFNTFLAQDTAIYRDILQRI